MERGRGSLASRIQSVMFQQMLTISLDLKACGSVTLEGVPGVSYKKDDKAGQSCLGGRCSYKKDDKAGPVVSSRKDKRDKKPPLHATANDRERPAIHDT